jgi:hypothetical protein
MKKFQTTFLLLVSILGMNSFSNAQKVLLDEDFNTNRNNWSSYLGARSNYLIYNGKYIIGINDSLTYNIGMPVTLDDGINFTITVTTTHTDGMDNYGYGIYFGSSDLNNYYSFNITSGGYFRMGKFSDIVAWTKTPAVRIGNYVDNVLQITRQGTNWIFEINGQTVSTQPATAFMGNKLGFTQSMNQRIEYDNLKVVQN